MSFALLLIAHGYDHPCRWAAILGVVLAISRAFIQDSSVALDPELALLEVCAHTHYLPRHWRGRAHTHEVQAEFEAMFQFKASTASSTPAPAGNVCTIRSGWHGCMQSTKLSCRSWQLRLLHKSCICKPGDSVSAI